MMDNKELYERIDVVNRDLQDLKTKQAVSEKAQEIINKDTADKIKEINTNLDLIKKHIQKIFDMLKEISGVKKLVVAIAGIVIAAVPVLTYYNEYLSNKPSPVIQQKEIGDLWNNVDSLNKMLAKMQGEMEKK
ncbi:hypothetical protein [Francisella philomiragia]|uniref:Uncharacterized protein n=1 Tax=Francisella philomiragia TaxID=28110 RepID=A0ABS1GCY7_9GAMM|nr:hypothetical protein [Francisella philomiragia]MBK2258998.1 hypothetical protein [Francisella philomiragia]MBK2302689.1 hypothetical protein [Francisella philomiragia]